MRVRMKATLSGTHDGQPWPERGGHADLTEDEAQHLIKAGLAEQHTESDEPGTADEAETPEEDEPTVETATLPDEAEKAVPTGRRRNQTK